jgi:hypothetical protein
MDYDKSTFEAAVAEFGEVFFVLDTGREYIVHGTDGYELKEKAGHTMVRVRGLRDDELTIAEFPLDAIEHHWTHKEI